MFRLEDLTLFVRAAALGSFSEAAREAGQQPAQVSAAIKRLETTLNIRLFARSTRSLRLTPEGEKIMPFLRDILRSQEQLDQTAAELRGLSAGTVRIATFTSVAVHWLPGMMQEFQTLYPHVEFKLFNGDYHDVDRWLTDGSVDIGFITLPTAMRCECIPLREDRLLAILPENHPLAKKDVCPVKEVAALPFISLLESSDDDARRALDAAGVKPNVRFTTKDDYAILAMVSQGLGVSIVHSLLLQPSRYHVVSKPLNVKQSREICITVKKGFLPSTITQLFLQHVVDYTRGIGEINVRR